MDTETSGRIRIANLPLTQLDICDLLRDNKGGYGYIDFCNNNNYGSNTILGEIGGVFKSEGLRRHHRFLLANKPVSP